MIHAEVIVVTPAPHVGDPLDQAPVLLHIKDGLRPHAVKLARVKGWRGRLFGLGIRLVRWYVNNLIAEANKNERAKNQTVGA